MAEFNNLSKSLEYTLKNSDLQKATIGLAEVLTDNLMEDGIAKDIPILRTVIGLGKACIGIKEIIFLKKIIYFISELKDISAVKRREMIDRIDTSGKFRIKIGEKLLYIIDKCEDHEKSQLIALLFSAFLSKKINYDDFLRASHIVNQVTLEDLKWFVTCRWKKENSWRWRLGDNEDYLALHEAGNIAISGLMELVSPEVTIRNPEDWKEAEVHGKYVVEGSELTVRISDIGKKIRDILKDHFLN